MRLVFATPLSVNSSTLIGRIVPFASELSRRGHVCHLLILKPASGRQKNVNKTVSDLRFHYVGREPFTRSLSGKRRQHGAALLVTMLITSILTFWRLLKLRPDFIFIVKPFPSNVLGVWFYLLFSSHTKIVLDVDDFELTANRLVSLAQRAALHWSERTATRLADIIVTATPFLTDHFRQLSNERKSVSMIPTGITLPFEVSTVYGKSKMAVNSQLTITYVGSLSISSGHRIDLLPEILQELFRHNIYVQLLIAGDGHDQDSLKKLFDNTKLSHAVIWHGRFTMSEVPMLLTQTSIFVDPIDAKLVNRAKSSFRVALAVASGLPIVTSNIGIRPYLIPENLHPRFFAEPADPQSYANVIRSLISHPLSPADQAAMRAHARKNSWEYLGSKYEKLLV